MDLLPAARVAHGSVWNKGSVTLLPERLAVSWLVKGFFSPFLYYLPLASQMEVKKIRFFLAQAQIAVCLYTQRPV